MNIKFLLIGTSLSLIPNFTQAQCVATTDCASLGYTETSCPNGKGLKCPFGTTFACPATDQSVCEKNGFKYDCKGTGYTSGIGQTCNNKYTSCTCNSGYEWKSGKCEKVNTPSNGTLGTCTGYAKNCSIGDILNSDGTCSSDKVSGKTPIGIVVYISSDGCGQAMSLDNVFRNINSGDAIQRCSFVEDSSLSARVCSNFVKDYYFSSVKNHDEALNDFDSCGNTKKLNEVNNKIDAAGYQGVYPYGFFAAARSASEYIPQNAQDTKGKWCLPAAGTGRKIYENYKNFNDIIRKLNGDLFKEPSSFYASSTLGKVEKSENTTTSTSFTTIYNWGWLYNAGVLYPLGYISYDAYYLGLDRQTLIRPVIEF